MINKSIIKIIAASLSALLVLASCDITKDVTLTALSEPVVTAQVSTHEVNISWEPVKNADTYVYVFNGNSSVSTKATHLQFSGLYAGTDYSFSVKAVANGGSYVNSNETSKVFTTLAEDVSLKATLADASFDGITINYESGQDVASINWYIGSEFTYAEDYAAFVSGKTTKSLAGGKGKFTVTTDQGLQNGEPSVVFIQAVSNEGVKGDIIEIKATAAPIAFVPSYISLGSFVATVGEPKSSDYVGLGFLVISNDEMAYYEEYGMTPLQVFDFFADFVESIAPGESQIVSLNGEPNVDHYLGLYYFGEDQTVEALSIVSYTSGEVDPSALDATLTVTVENIGENSADLCFAPGKNACGYVYRLFSSDDFEYYYNWGEKYCYVDPMEYIRVMVDAYGSRDYKAKTDSRTALKAGSYVLVSFPYNVNGTQGWGDVVINRFSTAAPAEEVSASKAPASIPEPVNANVEKISKLLGKIVR